MNTFFKRIANEHLSRFEINYKNLDLIVRCFYGMAAIVFFQFVLTNLDETIVDLKNRSIWLWPVQWLNFIPEKSPVIFTLIMGGFLLSVVCALFPHKKWLRVLFCLFSFQNLALIYSPAKIDHVFHAVLFISFWLIFMDLHRGGKSIFIKEQNKLYLWAAQITFLGTYFLSGLWKARRFVDYLMEMGWSDTPRCLVTNFAHQYIAQNSRTPFFMGILESFEGVFINHLLWIGVILFQISAPITSWFPVTQRVYGLLIVLFHASISILMDFSYFPHQCIAIIFLVCHPYQRKK